MKTNILLDYKILQEPNSDVLTAKVLELSKQGYELHGHLVVSGEYQYTIFIQGMVKYEVAEIKAGNI